MNNPTDKRIKAMLKRLENAYKEAIETAINNQMEAVKKLASNANKAKVEEIKRDIKQNRQLQLSLAKEIADVGKTAEKIIQGELSGIYLLNYDFTAYTVQQQADIDLISDFTIYNKKQLAVLMQESQSPFTKVAYNKLGQNAKIVKRLQDQFIQAVLLGESRVKIINRIKTVATMSAKQAKRIAQTESTRVRNQGIDLGVIEANKIGVTTQKRWVARMKNTRDLHQLAYGEVVDSKEKFTNGLEYPGDPNGSPENIINCYCGIIAIAVSVSEQLKKTREKFDKNMNFEEYRRRRNGIKGQQQ